MRKSESHPLLWGERRGGRKYIHGFTAAEMESLASICETLLPPLPLRSFEGKDDQSSKAMQSFYKASGSQTPIPDEVAELLVKRAIIEAQEMALRLQIFSIILGEERENSAEVVKA
uniref:Uncharacterized protein n=1 Tax=Fagus sylvatica TaxID=28930 RepID=A0A2N9FFV4_FAGSY